MICFLPSQVRESKFTERSRDHYSLNLTYDGGLQTLVMMGGGGLLKVPPPLFLFVKTIEKVIRLCTVLKKNSLIDSFKDKAIFHVILEIDR